jgi:hypothetical protein
MKEKCKICQPLLVLLQRWKGPNMYFFVSHLEKSCKQTCFSVDELEITHGYTVIATSIRNGSHFDFLEYFSGCSLC